ncbi:MAG: 4Fe-4S dicluster domain-containing protein [Fibrobacter sp.]|nr:4Fe-4S dicluster domain-containing protein [Fibrobacter sp.]
MKEIVIISGKGGTGKTSIAASFASLAAGKAVFADCDVDAADLHLILKPTIKQNTEFRSGHKAFIVPDKCTGCGKCIELCRFEAIKRKSVNKIPEIDPVGCEGCGVCVRFCPSQAITFDEEVCGEWFISDTRFGPMVHAKLGIAAENSGRLVTLVRNEAKRIAESTNASYVLIDGSPGIGCPVIASLTAASLALIVTEPTVSGDHDFRRIAGLTKRLGIPAMVCVNKWDINPEKTEEIRNHTQKEGLLFAGMVQYGKTATVAQRSAKCIVEFPESKMAVDIENVWEKIDNWLKKQ